MASVPESSVRPDHNALGKAAFITGLIGLVLSFVPIIGFVSWLLAPLAILFGLIALRRRSRSLAIAGIFCGLIAIFVCVSWIRATKAVGEAMTADTFNTSGKVVDNKTAPLIDATVRGVWKDMEDNKIAAGKKYGGHQLVFKDEPIKKFSGDAANPAIQFVGKDDEIMEYYVSASFDPADGAKIGALKKGAKIGFTCTDIKETFGDGYSLGGCKLK